eukprot:12211684-Alexandrium_andersonii.AAC.1
MRSGPPRTVRAGAVFLVFRCPRRGELGVGSEAWGEVVKSGAALWVSEVVHAFAHRQAQAWQ